MSRPDDIGGSYEEATLVDKSRRAHEMANRRYTPFLSGIFSRLGSCDVFRDHALHELDKTKQNLAGNSRKDTDNGADENGQNRPSSISISLTLPAFFLGSQVIEVAVGPAGKAVDFGHRLAGNLADKSRDIAERDELAHVAVLALATGRPGEHVEYAVGRVPTTFLDGEQIRERLLELRVQPFHVLSFLAFVFMRGFYHRDAGVMT